MMASETPNGDYARLSEVARAAEESWPGATVQVREGRLDVLLETDEATISLVAHHSVRRAWEVVHMVHVHDQDVFMVWIQGPDTPIELLTQIIAATRTWLRASGRQEDQGQLAQGKVVGRGGSVSFNPPIQDWARYADMHALYLTLSRQLIA